MLNFEQNKCGETDKQVSSPQNLEAIERLAGGMAHEFNNLLCVILNYSCVLLENLDPDDLKASDLREIKSAAERAAGLIQQLLAFGCKQILQPNILDINILIGDMERLIRPLLGQDIEFLIRLKDNLGKVKADPKQIEQAIINLTTNARDAMPNGGKLTIATDNVFLDDIDANRNIGLDAGDYVEITISDTGHGMDDETRSRIFEPFFTTREKGEGKGLGLSATYGFIRQSNGRIAVHSEPGCGTTFKIYLPQVD